ncbi:MAG TPA: hypothetical protein VGX28_16180 [Frankiaceae bacterium]|jgi:hypothetical protein|nr:hypothetical protein [Frankiaceae bacterium]
MRTGVRVLTAVIAAGVAVACSDPTAAPLPSASPSTAAPSSSSPSPSATDFAGEVRAAIETYYRTLNQAAHQPASQTEALAALIDPGCPCFAVVRFLRQEAERGRYLDYSYSARDVRVIDAGSLGANATYVVVQSPGSERTNDGRIVASFPGSTERFSVRFIRTADGRWLLNRAERVR